MRTYTCIYIYISNLTPEAWTCCRKPGAKLVSGSCGARGARGARGSWKLCAICWLLHLGGNAGCQVLWQPGWCCLESHPGGDLSAKPGERCGEIPWSCNGQQASRCSTSNGRIVGLCWRCLDDRRFFCSDFAWFHDFNEKNPGKWTNLREIRRWGWKNVFDFLPPCQRSGLNASCALASMPCLPSWSRCWVWWLCGWTLNSQLGHSQVASCATESSVIQGNKQQEYLQEKHGWIWKSCGKSYVL